MRYFGFIIKKKSGEMQLKNTEFFKNHYLFMKLLN